MRARQVAIALVAALVLVAAACGEDDAAVTPSAETGSGAVTPVTGAGSGEGEQMPKQWSQEPAMMLEQGKDYGAVLHTNKGDIVVDLDENGAPKTVNNFVFLANEDYYTNVPFHRIISGFMIQTGDPTGTGSGGPGYRFADEPITKDYERGTLAMANAGPNTNGSQFFICHDDLTAKGQLQKNYTIFGKVVEGMDVVDAIAAVPVKPNARGENSVPTEPVTIESVEITVS
jgi:cyclophilin family peptidyl-prolyl cis-trans isomerase